MLALSNAAVSPYVYLYRSRRIQREVRRLLGLPLSANKAQGGGSGRRRPFLRPLQMIPPSPTALDANFDSSLGPPLARTGLLHPSPFTTLITKLFRAKGFAGEPWRDSITSTTSSTITSSSTGYSAASGQSENSTTESESMLPRVAVPEAGS